MRRRFSGRARTALYLAAGGVCQDCGAELEPGFHADHVVPWSVGGATDVINGQALCPACNLRKGSTLNTPPLRKWQERALNLLFSSDQQNFLVEATPGSGKTMFAVEAVKRWLASGKVTRLVVVVPTKHLKVQWARVFDGRGINVNPFWESSTGPIASDMQGVVVTYQQVAANPTVLRHHAGRERTVAVFDEIHHCGDEESWGLSLAEAFNPALYRLSLSGTPFRTRKNSKIPFVRYVDGQGKPDFTFGYDDALRDEVCRHIYFPRRGGRMEWFTSGGVRMDALLDDEIDEERQNERLRTTIAADGGWIGSVIEDAHDRLVDVRRSDPDAAGLVVCEHIDHAREVAARMRTITGVRPLVVVSDDPDASQKIARFEKGAEEWLVAVRMVSEGIDIPRLRVGVFATVTTTELFFRQVAGRLLRVEGGEDDDAWLFIPDDRRLRLLAEQIAEQRDHVIDETVERALSEREAVQGQLPSLGFMPISSTASNEGTIARGEHFTKAELDYADSVKMKDLALARLPSEILALAFRKSKQVGVPADIEPVGDETTPAWERIKNLRAKNHRLAVRVAVRTGETHQAVNFAANQAVRVGGVKECSEDQLGRRLEFLNRCSKEDRLISDAG